MKKELLSPAGDMECLKAAIHAGCDAVYVGGKKFGARKFASNFDSEELISAVKYCHLYGVKLYVTVNTLIYENEMTDVLEYVKFLNEIGIDAIIVQDIGLITKIREYLPNMEIHASTQCHNYNSEQFELMKSLGVTRVVLARELSLDEVNNIDTSLEKEVFIHGALCISYSGQCLFSSLIMGRSGNRGECAGMCRLPYTLLDKNKNVVKTDGDYLLSTKELSTIDNFKELMDSDITCFKIEGRMKSKEYVYLVTKIYRTLMDKYYNNETVAISEEDFNNLKIIFNREFTSGHLFSKHGKELMNITTPNNIGDSLGKVIDVNKNKITIKLDKDIYQEDGIRFSENNSGMIVNFLYDKNGKLINSAKQNDIIYVDNKVNLNTLSEVRKTSSNKLNKDLSNYVLKKIKINIICELKVGEKIKLSIIDSDKTEVQVFGSVVEIATNCPISYDRVKEQLEKLGNTPFISESTNILMDDNIFVSIKELNELRRIAVHKLIDVRENKKKEVIINKINIIKNDDKSDSINISCLVRTKEQLDACLDNNIDSIYVDNYNLYQEYKMKKNVYFRLPRVNKKKFNLENENIMLTDMSLLDVLKNNLIVTDYHLNVVNSAYVKYLIDKGVKKICLSVENNVMSIKNIGYYKYIEVLVYGKTELMIMNHCILNMLVNNDNKICNVCSDKYYLKDRNNKIYDILSNNRTTEILSYDKYLFNKEEIIKLKEIGVNNFRLDFYDENKDEVISIIENYKNILQIENKVC